MCVKDGKREDDLVFGKIDTTRQENLVQRDAVNGSPANEGQFLLLLLSTYASPFLGGVMLFF